VGFRVYPLNLTNIKRRIKMRNLRKILKALESMGAQTRKSRNSHLVVRLENQSISLPLKHKELPKGTLGQILRRIEMAGISKVKFIEAIKAA
jgi:predicted RNA binding protein YcfA (HicA-like mRNA interferase family)